MKRRTFYHISLSLPYLALAFCWGISYLTGAFEGFLNTPLTSSILPGLIAFFAISGIIWGPFYAWMVVVMLLWGRNRSTEDIRRLYMLSPLLLAGSMGVPVIASSLPDAAWLFVEGFLQMNHLGYAAPLFAGNTNEEPLFQVGAAWLFMAVTCIVMGYAFVGFVLLIERGMTRRGLFKDDK